MKMFMRGSAKYSSRLRFYHKKAETGRRVLRSKGRPRREQTHASPSRRAQLPEAHAFAAQQRGLDLRHV